MLTPYYVIGAAIAYGLYNQLQDSGNRISFGIYMLFIGVAMAITVCSIIVPSPETADRTLILGHFCVGFPGFGENLDRAQAFANRCRVNRLVCGCG